MVTASGWPRTFPEFSSIGTRHRSRLPPGSLRNRDTPRRETRPLPVHSPISSDFTAHRPQPDGMDVLAPSRPKSATQGDPMAVRRPVGLRTFCRNEPLSPDATLIAEIRLVRGRSHGGICHNAFVGIDDLLPIRRPGRVEAEVRQPLDAFACPPITKMPPPSRSERKAMRSPSGENAGCVSPAAESSVKLTGSFRLPFEGKRPNYRKRSSRKPVTCRREKAKGKTTSGTTDL